MDKHQPKSPKWTDVKARLANFDRPGLVGLIQDLYSAHKDNRTFLHTRLCLGENLLEPYKQTISRWIRPDVYRSQETSVAKAKQAITSCKKAVGDAAGMAELTVYYCEQAAEFGDAFGYSRDSYFNTRDYIR